jgi:hypothetical protein
MVNGLGAETMADDSHAHLGGGMRNNFTFEVTADESGIVSVVKNAPVKLRINKLHARTTSNCQMRRHDVVASVDGVTVIQATVSDCEAYESSPNVDVAVGSAIALRVDGFSPGEQVAVEGFVEFALRLFG